MNDVVLLGTSHKYQTREHGVDTAHADQFKNLLISLCFEHLAKGIAEEMNQVALAERGISESVAQIVSATLGVKHQLSDPTPKIRQQLGIRGENEIRMDGWFKNWDAECIETEVRKSYEIREKYWLTQLQAFNLWPVIFVCGANHTEPFSTLLRKNEFEVVVAFADWMPNPSFQRDSPEADCPSI